MKLRKSNLFPHTSREYLCLSLRKALCDEEWGKKTGSKVDEEKKNGITEIAGNNEMDEQQREKTAGSIELILCHGSIS